jgi:hypothetical protein
MKKFTIVSSLNSLKLTAPLPSETRFFLALSWDPFTTLWLSRCLWTLLQQPRLKVARCIRLTHLQHAI